MIERVHECLLRPFSFDGRLYRAFGHVIAARPGSVLTVPMVRVAGDLSDLVDLCPAPWDEVLWLTELETGQAHAAEALPPELARLAGHGWDRLMAAFCEGLPELEVFIHGPSGVRFATAG